MRGERSNPIWRGASQASKVREALEGVTGGLDYHRRGGLGQQGEGGTRPTQRARKSNFLPAAYLDLPTMPDPPKFNNFSPPAQTNIFPNFFKNVQHKKREQIQIDGLLKIVLVSIA